MYQVILFIHVLVCIAVIILVLIQHGKGADIGASFGSGASNTVFGSQGSGSFLMKVTGFFAAAFFTICLILGSLATYSSKQSRLLDIPKLKSSVASESSTEQEDSSNASIPKKDSDLGKPEQIRQSSDVTPSS
jgi:preprotein translocase subunit SecG